MCWLNWFEHSQSKKFNQSHSNYKLWLGITRWWCAFPNNLQKKTCPSATLFLHLFVTTLVNYFWSTVSFQMSPQIEWFITCIVAMVTCIWFHSRVGCQMSSQTTCIERCIVTLVALVQFFSRVCLQMCFQTPFPERCKATDIAFVRFFTWVDFQMCL